MTATQIQQMMQQGLSLLQQGNISQATQHATQMVQQLPGAAESHFVASEVAKANSNLPLALKHIDIAITLDPKAPDLLLNKAHIFLALRQRFHAAETAAEAARLGEQDPRISKLVGDIFGACDDHNNAVACYRTARALAPEHPGIIFELAKSLFYLGEMDEAESLLETFLKASPHNGEALQLRSRLKKQTEKQNHVEELEKLVEGNLLKATDKIRALYALAKEHEDMGHAPQSFQALKEGASIQRQQLGYNSQTETQNMRDVTSHCAKQAFKELKKGTEETGPIFVLGLPRSGTTLVERILSNHKDVVSAGELPDFTATLVGGIESYKAKENLPDLSPLDTTLKLDFHALGRNYIGGVRQIVGTSPYFIDKMPSNFQYCGLIKKAMPNAKILHLVRDPMDSCYAIYKTLFNQAYFFSYDLEELADYYIAYRAMMKEWHAMMPGEILDISYESLVQSPEAIAPEMFTWCGLSYDDNALDIQSNTAPSTTASAAQIREPIYTSSVAKWRSYETELQPLKEKLMAANLVDEKGNAL